MMHDLGLTCYELVPGYLKSESFTKRHSKLSAYVVRVAMCTPEACANHGKTIKRLTNSWLE